MARKHHLVYAIVNDQSHEMYIGFTSLPLETRWAAHCSQARRGSKFPIHAAIATHGSHNFSLKILRVALSREKAMVIESSLIQLYSTHLTGYNKAIGFSPSSEMKKKIAQKLKGRQSPTLGMKMSEKTRNLHRITANNRNRDSHGRFS